MSFRDIFIQVFQKNHLQTYIQDDIIEKFEMLTNIMVEKNKVMNITALTTIEKIIPLHYADCLKIAEYIPQGAKVLDIGCGGGFPILPLAIVRKDLKISGLDSTDKKIQYVKQTAETLQLPVQVISARAEEVAKDELLRENYDVVISRAVARLNVLDELCLPFVRKNATFIAMKGAAGNEETEEARIGIETLGGSVKDIIEYNLHTIDNTEKRTVVLIEKTRNTPKEYPRSFGNIKKKPL